MPERERMGRGGWRVGCDIGRGDIDMDERDEREMMREIGGGYRELPPVVER